jgi:NADPH:quinone reductase-like Zn-dependent oxidoreductase
MYRRAIVTQFGQPDVIQVQEENTLPAPDSDEVRIRIEASSMVFTDTLIRRGIYPYLQKEPPFTLGYDFTGVVDAVGGDVTAFKVGDRVADVTQIGGNADYIVRPAAQLIRVPSHLNPVQVETLLLSGMTAYQMLHRIAQVKPGQRILVQGGMGAVGNMLVQLGLLHGLDVVTTVSADNFAPLRTLGAEAVDYRTSDAVQQLRTLGGRDGYHAAFDGVGLSSFRRSFGLLAPEGTLVPYGFVAPARNVTLKTPLGSLIGGAMFASSSALFSLWSRLPGNRSVKGYDLVSYRREFPQAYTQDIQQMFALLETRQLNPLIHRTYPLHQIRQAHTAFSQGGIRGRIVISHL